MISAFRFLGTVLLVQNLVLDILSLLQMIILVLLGYLMKNCSELFSVFPIFCAEIRNQFGMSIRVLRSDNAKEF